MFRPKITIGLSVFAILSLSACGFGASMEGKKWELVEAENGAFSEERTVGKGLKWVLVAMAPAKDMALKVLSKDTPPEILNANKPDIVWDDVKPAKGESMMGMRISKDIPLEYGELNFYSTKPKPRVDEHILDERPKITILKDYNDAQLEVASEPISALKIAEVEVAEVEIIQELDPIVETAPEMTAKEEVVTLKKADSLFKSLALDEKK